MFSLVYHDRPPYNAIVVTSVFYPATLTLATDWFTKPKMRPHDQEAQMDRLLMLLSDVAHKRLADGNNFFPPPSGTVRTKNTPRGTTAPCCPILASSRPGN